MDTYPWQQTQWQALDRALGQQRLPHALLLCGPRGTGKADFARAFARYLLCERRTPEHQACGQCRGCLLFAAGTHPDYHRCEPEEEGKIIPVDAIREMSARLDMASQYTGGKVVLITPAEQMNVAAANSLLKTLEEPTPGTVLLLVTSQPDRLLPTVRSRCQKILFPTPPRRPALEWLRGRTAGREPAPELLLDLADGAPLAALELADTELLAQRAELVTILEQLGSKGASPVELAERGKDLDPGRVIYWLMGWTADMIRFKFSASPVRLEHPDLRETLQRHAARMELTALYRFSDLLQEALRLSRTQANERLLMEEIFCSWAELPRQ